MSCSHPRFYEMAAQQWPEPAKCPDCGRGKLEIREASARAARRERVSTAVMQGMMAAGASVHGAEGCASTAVRYADALIAELDREAD